MARLPFIENMDNSSVNGIESPILKITKNGRYTTQNLDRVSVNVVPTGYLKITENGDYNVANLAKVTVDVEGGTPTPVTPTEPPVKGDVIILDGHKYRVLSADGWNCKLMYLGPNVDLSSVPEPTLYTGEGVTVSIDSCKSNWYQSSPTSEQKVTFLVDGVETLGMKYDGSNIDTFCNETFLGLLPADVQAAITEQEVNQEMYACIFGEKEESDTYGIEGTWGLSYRIQRKSEAPVVIGNRKITNISVKDIFDYYGKDSITNNELNDFIFDNGGVQGTYSDSNYAWLRDAYSGGDFRALYVYGYAGYVYNGYFRDTYGVRCSFLINLKDLVWYK